MTWRDEWNSYAQGHRVALIASGFAALVIVALVWRLNAAQGAQAEAARLESVARARADTTRMLRDSLGFQRLVIQQTQRRDDVDRALDEMRRALVTLSIAVATREVRNTPASAPTTETAGGVRHATFDARTTPYTVHAEVSVPPPPAPANLDLLRVSTDPFTFDARLGCTNKVNALGMRDAMLTLTNLPEWAKPTIAHVEQDPSVCPSPVLERDKSGDDRSRLALSLGGGYTFPQPAGRLFVGLTISKPIPCPKVLRGRVWGC